MALHVPETLAEALDPAWLAEALAPVSGGAPILSLELAELIKTMASKARIRVRFANHPNEVKTYCLKAFLDYDQDPASGGATTIREIDFYQQIAPRITMRVPGCEAFVIDREKCRGMLIMRDLITEGARFCSALDPFTADEAAQSLEQIARLHAASPMLAEFTWLPNRSSALAKPGYFTPEIVQPLLDDPRGKNFPPRTRDAKLLFQAMAKLAERNEHRPQTVLHGDCHAGNIYWTAQGPGFTDWQLIQRGNWANDVAYHINAILPIDVAEKSERDLLHHYLDTVASLGGKTPGREEAWEDYRCAQLYGFFHWAITRRVDPAITNLATDRLGAGVTRHETYKLLGL